MAESSKEVPIMCVQETDRSAFSPQADSGARQIGSIIGTLPELEALRERANRFTILNMFEAAKHPQPSAVPALRRGIA